MAKQLKKFCRITKYIEKTDPKLHEILDDLCMLGAFRPRRGHSGTTFLWPSKDTVAELDKMRYTDDIDKGCDIVLAHIVHDNLPNGAAWNAKKNDIPNGSNKKVEVKAVAGNKVTLADGAELEHDDKFRTFRTDGETQSVWRVVKGKIDPSRHNKPATGEHSREGAPRPQPEKTEGGSRHRSFHHRVGGSLLSYIMGGAAHAQAPFGWLVEFFKFVEAKGNEEQTNELRIIYSPEMVTTCAFLSRKDSGFESLFEEFAAAETKNVHGSGDYFKLLTANYGALKGASGGGYANHSEIQAALAQIITACDQESKKALATVKVSAKFTSRVFTALNLSRWLESQTLKHIPTDDRLRSEKAGAIQDMCEMIHSRANDLSPETDIRSQGLGALISSLLVELDKFRKCGYATFPIGDQSVFGPARKQCESVYGPDTSVSAVLSKMTAEQLSSLFSTLGSDEPEHKEEKEPVEAPEN